MFNIDTWIKLHFRPHVLQICKDNIFDIKNEDFLYFIISFFQQHHKKNAVSFSKPA